MLKDGRTRALAVDRGNGSFDRGNTEKLRSLKAQGYCYLQTPDDGDTWTGSHGGGLPLDELLRLGKFRGNIVVGDASDTRRE